MRATCYGLMRTFGMAGFLVVGLGSLYAGNNLFGLELDLSRLFLSGGDRKALALAIGSMLVGLVGLIVGQGIGASIPVRSLRACSAICIAWHSGANGCLSWVMLAGTSIGLQMGKQIAEQWILTFGMWKLTGVMVATGVPAGWLVGVAHYVVGRRLLEQGKEGQSVLVPWLVSFGAGAVAGAVLAGATSTAVWAGAATGLILPVCVVTLTNWTLGRDEQLRSSGSNSIRPGV